MACSTGFQRVADGEAQRLVLIGDERLHSLIQAAADAHHQLSQAARVHFENDLLALAGGEFEIVLGWKVRLGSRDPSVDGHRQRDGLRGFRREIRGG